MTVKKYFLMAALAALPATPSHATGTHSGYFGISGGSATVDDFCGGGEASCDDSAATFRVYAGSEFDRVASWELGYRYIDDVDASGYFGGVAVGLAVNGHFVDTTLQLAMPETGPFKVIGKAGLMLWRLDYEIAATNGFQSARMSDDDTGYAFRTGLGVSYEVSDSLRIRADWDYLMNVGDEDDLGETDISIFSIGPEFRF